MDNKYTEIGAGWNSLVLALYWEIRHSLPDGVKLVEEQVKQKFGGLRYYYHIDYSNTFGTYKDFEGDNEDLISKIDKLVSAAELKSYTICEQCGKPGRLRKGSYLETLCDDHSQLRLPFADFEMWGHGRG